MDLDPRRPFAENIASGLQGLTLPTTIFLYFVSVVMLVPLSILAARVLPKEYSSSPYLIPLLVLLFIVAAHHYCRRLRFERGPSPLLLYAALLSGIVYVGYRIPADFMDRTGPYFDVVRRSLYWLFGGTVVRTVLAPLALLFGYGLLYYAFGIRGRRFIVVSDFRVWGELKKKIPPKGVAGRLQDELMRLLAEMRASESGLPMERAKPDDVSGADGDSRRPKPVLGGGFVPETQVTLQYEGISFEGLHTFIRRKTGREVVITGDLFTHPHGFLLTARTTNDGPWEVLVKTLDANSLRVGLERLAVRILTTLAQSFLPTEPDIFVFLQFKAEELKEYDLVVRLAHLALEAVPYKYEISAQHNLAKAYFKKGTWLTLKRKHNEACLNFKEATDWYPNYYRAWNSLGAAYKKIGDEKKASEAFQEAERIRVSRTSRQ